MPRYWGETLSAVAFILISLYVGNMALAFPAGGGTFPLFAVGGTILLSLIMIAQAQLRRTSRLERRISYDLSYAKLKPAIVTGLVILYVLAIFELGYFTSTALFLVVASVVVGLRRPVAIAVTAVVLLPLMYVFFELFLQANLPQGALI